MEENLFEIQIYEGFKLIRLELLENNFLGTIKYEFIEAKDKQDKIYTTVIIGANGTGKSNLFKIIIELFKDLNELKNDRSRSYNVAGGFSLEYSLNNNYYRFSNIYTDENNGKKEIRARDVALFINYIQVAFEKVEFPIAIVAHAFTLTDKFPFPNEQKFPQYKYLGIKNRPQNASTRAFVRKTIEHIVKSLESKAFVNGVKKIKEDFLQTNFDPYITYYTSNTARFFNGNLKKESFETFFNDIQKQYSKSETEPPFKLSHYLSQVKNDSEFSERISKYCNHLVNTERLEKANRLTMAMYFNLVTEADLLELQKEYEMIEHLRNLGMFHAPEIEFYRPNENTEGQFDYYPIAESSSGESHLFSSMIGLMASVKSNSLIFIDEPEISLHPNWQMKYLSFLTNLFSSSEYKTCHLIIATHSHFILSDLEGSNSKIIGLTRKDKGQIEIIELTSNLNTFGWSAEEILLKVFQTPSTRNYFIADKVGKILELLSKKNRNEELIKTMVKDLIDENILKLSDEDPLKPVINKLTEKYG